MKADVELKLTHDGNKWIGQNEQIVASGESLNDLDEEVKCALQKSGSYAAGAQLTVFMGFDFETFPRWLRQYHNHYFNRCVSLVL
ncbi:MAG TPA: hypothetical protein ENI80_03730 [Acidiferrobacteraceae bacterium]|nr:hypothetical protein [Acidiferrobacteraceae bacterium]